MGDPVWSRPRSNIVRWSPRDGIVDRISDGSVPLPAIDVGRVVWSSADGRLPTGDGNSDGSITTGFQRWNTDSDVEDQYETFNGMPVYYSGDLYDSEDSDWDDPLIVLFQAMGPWRTSMWTGWTMWIMMIRMFGPLRI